MTGTDTTKRKVVHTAADKEETNPLSDETKENDPHVDEIEETDPHAGDRGNKSTCR